MKVLVAVASKHGSTQDIADALARGLQARGVDGEARHVDEIATLEGYDAVVLGSAVYAGRWMKDARHAVHDLEEQLRARPVWLFSSGTIGDQPLESGEPTNLAKLIETTGARGHVVFAGRIDEADLGRVERTVLRAVHADTGDYRDWDAIDAFAGEVAAALTGNRTGAGAQ